MKCARVLELIEDHHYGELNRRAADRLESHLRHCRECSEAVEALEEESRLFRAYAKGIELAEVKPAVWEAVRRRIRDLPRSRTAWHELILRYSGVTSQPPSRLVLVCATGVIILLVSITVGYRYLGPKKVIDPKTPSPLAQAGAERGGISPASQDPGGRADRSGDSARHRNSIQFAEWSIRRAEEEYIEAIEVLSVALTERKDRIDPQLVASFERDVKAVDRNIAASRKAYRARPRDFDLGQYMLTAYARKLEMLQTLGS